VGAAAHSSPDAPAAVRVPIPWSTRGCRRVRTYDPVLGHRYIPGLRARIEHEGGGYLLQTNSEGFRCQHEFVPRRPPGTRRILLFGDSFTAGTGVSDHQRYGNLLERRLPGVAVYNFAIAAAGIDQQLLAFREAGAGLERDLAVIGVWTDTIRRVAARWAPVRDDDGRVWLRPKPYFELVGQALLRRNVPVPRTLVAPDGLPPSDRDHAPLLDTHQQVREYENCDHPKWRLLRAVLEKLCAELQCPVVMLLLPPYRHVEGLADPAPAHTRLRELHQPPGVIVHDALPRLAAGSFADRRALRFASDYHPTPAYHRIIADSVTPVVGDLLSAG
jgi:hypothetical protein